MNETIDMFVEEYNDSLVANIRAYHIELILKQYDLFYEKEKSYDDLKYQGKLRYDFYIPDLNLLIEYDGEQHFRPVNFNGSDNKSLQNDFIKSRARDQQKDLYAMKNHINLMRVPFWLRESEFEENLLYFIKHEAEDIRINSHHKQYLDYFMDLLNLKEVKMNLEYDNYLTMLKKLKRESYKVSYQLFILYLTKYCNLQFIKINKEGYDYYEIYSDLNSDDYDNYKLRRENEEKNKEANNDILVQFINELIDQNILYNSHLPSSFLYEYFKSWLQDVNPGAKPMKLSEFTKRFKSLIFNKGYTEIKRWRFKQLKNYQFKFNDFENLDFNRETKSTIFINPEMNIENKIDDIENDLKNLTYEELSDQYSEKVIRSYIQYLITEKPEDALLIFSKYQIHEISDLDYDVILIELDKYFKGEI